MNENLSNTPQDVMRQLKDEHAELPNRTLLRLALGGLKVRLAHSVITLVSVVLAIAYLSYSGSMNGLLYSLATSGNEEVEMALRMAGINIEATREGNPLDQWLIIMALLTCAVGIANAMLMSVTERFREIGTMKCLGAEDNAVVKLFLIESALVGLTGSIMGIALGLILSLTVSLLQFGGFTFDYLPWFAIVRTLALSILAGMLLCLIGAGYPAFIAARMRPVEALRVEE